MNAPSLITLTDVRKVYPGSAAQQALAGITLMIPTGQFVAIMGPSGSGKSTLLNLIAGLDRPSGGQVIVDGITVGSLGETALARFRRQRLGFVFQFFNLLNQLTVLDNVVIPAQLAGVKTAVARSRAKDLLAELGIADKARAYPARLSGGQRQRVAIARALINSPAVILADEPTGALDSRSGDAVMDLLAQLHLRGQTVVMVTHDTRLAASRAERIVSLRDGQVVDDTQLQSASNQQPSDLVRLRSEEVQP
ncbi:MAG TPA: ABC transporter ATP-binding protein [Ktedonobacterales bacterium]|nr:ABC transporter ATP-binding protein [Ktedonobacterales bacterium]